MPETEMYENLVQIVERIGILEKKLENIRINNENFLMKLTERTEKLEKKF